MKTKEQNEWPLDLPPGFTARGASLDDVGSALALFNRWSRAVIGRDEFTDDRSIRDEWQAPGVDPADDIRLIFAPSGELVGYVEIFTHANPLVHPELWGRVDPDYEDLGIGTWMIRWAEQRALRALSDSSSEWRFASRVGTYRQAKKAKQLFEDMGYQYFRSTYHMVIEMDGPVPKPEFPRGITLRTYAPATDSEAVYRAENDTFRDHFGHVEQSFEEGFQRWKRDREHEGYDPTLYFLAMDGEEIAGIIFCRLYSFYDADRGWVRSLGVRRPWRKRGLGLALLRHAFHEFYRRGKRKVGLGVDANNLTGALRLYESAGMRIEQAYDYYDKELRSGIEISVQSLAD